MKDENYHNKNKSVINNNILENSNDNLEENLLYNTEITNNLADDNEDNNNIYNDNQENMDITEKLKSLLIEQVFYQKYTAKNYEISPILFEEIIIPSEGNCFYSCISQYLYKYKEHHIQIRNKVFKYIVKTKEKFLLFFIGNGIESDNLIKPEDLLKQYIIDNNKEGEFARDLEYTAICQIYKIRIILLKKGFYGYNVYNIFNEEDFNFENNTTIYLNFINNNHFNYLEIKDIKF